MTARVLAACALVVSLAAPPVFAQTASGEGEPVRLRVNANGPVSLCRVVGKARHEFSFETQHVTEERVTYQPLCDAPCEVTLGDREGKFFFLQPDGVRSGEFTLLDQPLDVTAKVDVGNRALVTVGGVVIAVGAAALMIGAFDQVGEDHLRPFAVRSMLGGAAAVAVGATIVSFGDFDFRLFPTPRQVQQPAIVKR